MISQILCLFFVAAVLGHHGESLHLDDSRSNGVNADQHRVTRVNLNGWFDRYLPFVKKYMVSHGMDPMSLPAMNLPAPDIPGFKPKVELHNGLIHGISNLTRSGDIIQHIYESSSKVEVQVSWKELEVDYDYSVKYLFFNRKGGLTGRFPNLNIGMMGSVDFKARKVDLRYLKIIDSGDFSLKLRGHLMDTVANAALKALTVTFRKRMLREMEHQMNNAVQLKIKEVNNWLSNQSNIPIPRSVEEWNDLLN